MFASQGLSIAAVLTSKGFSLFFTAAVIAKMLQETILRLISSHPEMFGELFVIFREAFQPWGQKSPFPKI